jgi:hypothetical protein
MNLIDRLFAKQPNADDLRVQLKEIERDQKKKRRDMDVMAQNKQQKVNEAVNAKKAGKQELVRDIFREMRQLEIDNGYLNADLRRLSLAKTALTSFLRKMEMLEKRKDRKSLQNLIVRFQDSSIQKAIDSAEVDDDTFNDMLKDILGEEELAVSRGKEEDVEAGFAQFDKALEQMAGSMDSGDEETVKQMQHEIDKAVKTDKVQSEE